MNTLIQKEMRQTRKMLLIWISLVIMLIGFCYFEYLSLENSMDDMVRMLNQFPEILLLMFGVKAELSTALGWYCCIYFWISILAFAYALNLGISCVAKEMKNGTSSYLFTKPVPRTEIIFSKVIASALNLLIFSAFSGICNYALIILPAGGLEQPIGAFTTTIGMFLTQLMFFAVGFFAAGFIKKYKSIVQIGTVFLLLSYAIGITAQYTGIRFLDYLSPLRYFDVYEVTLNGISVFNFAASVIVIAICIVTATNNWKHREV